MNKQEALEEFLKGLRIAFNNALAYPREHPYFIKSAEEFKIKIEALLGFLDPIVLGIAPDSLFLDERFWVKPESAVELARIMHQRKIKKIQFSSGLKTDELADLLKALASSPRDIIKNGGLRAILEKTGSPHIEVEELDYSVLLGEGAAVEGQHGLWRRMFHSAASLADAGKMNNLADKFSSCLSDIPVKDMVSDSSLRGDLARFLRILKESGSRKLYKCQDELFSYLASPKYDLSDKDIQSLRELFSGLSSDDLARILWSNLNRDNSPDPLLFRLFLVLSEGLETRKMLHNNPLLAKKAQGFLLSASSQDLSPVYRNKLLSMLEDVSFSEEFYFDSRELKVNYAFVLLNLLDKEDNSSRQKLILARLVKDLGLISENGDYKYIKYLLGVLEGKQEKEGAPLKEIAELKGKLSELIEDGILEDAQSPDIAALAYGLAKSSKDSRAYLEKIFEEGKVNALSLDLFFKFFPGDLSSFYSGVEQQRNNLELITRIVDAASRMNSELSLFILERIYSSVNEVIKLVILKAIRQSPYFDPGFLYLALKDNSREIRKEALRSLCREQGAISKGISVLLDIKNTLGIKNRLILENMSIIEELGLKEGVEHLEEFAGTNLFWLASLKKKAREVLGGLGWKKE